MQILGFELDPDWAMYDGNFDLGVDWLLSDEERARGRRDALVPRPAFSTYDEQLRVMSTAAKPLARFHYRVVAGELAAEAAALLPPRSHAYAAALCEAAAHVGVAEGARASAYYQRYVDHGAYVDFAAHFGSDCPAPDFDAARLRYDDDDRLRPAFVAAAPPAPVRKRVIARDATILVAIAFATRMLARALAKRGVGAGLP
jgi:cellulose synthase operon protein C